MVPRKGTSMLMMAWYPYHLKLRQSTCSNEHTGLACWIEPPLTQVCVKLSGSPGGLSTRRLCPSGQGPRSEQRNHAHTTELRFAWEITSNTFTFSASNTNKPFTRRGVLSTVNSVFDHLGLLAPVTIHGRVLLRELTSKRSYWDTPLPQDKLMRWECLRDSLQVLKQLHVPGTYTTAALTQAVQTELCVFSDASTKAIGAVAYLKQFRKVDKLK